jgi:predicted dehydrogenase
MRCIIVGLGIQGKKRLQIAGSEAVATVDPFHAHATYRNIHEVPLELFDAALVCTPDSAKMEILTYLLSHGKHILVEKPLLALSSSEIEHLQKISLEKKAISYTAYNHRFEPHIVNLRALLASGELGSIYLAKFFYGNGTARDVRTSEWRDTGGGVMPDIGSHLLDMALFLFGAEHKFSFEPTYNRCFENRAFDYIRFSSHGPLVVDMEMTLLSWRNTFRADIFGERGSAHINSLCKWGPSTLTVYQRVLPSGRPASQAETLECADPTWQIEYDHFKNLCRDGFSNLENDIWINNVLNDLGNKMGVALHT